MDQCHFECSYQASRTLEVTDTLQTNRQAGSKQLVTCVLLSRSRGWHPCLICTENLEHSPVITFQSVTWPWDVGQGNPIELEDSRSGKHCVPVPALCLPAQVHGNISLWGGDLEILAMQTEKAPKPPAKTKPNLNNHALFPVSPHLPEQRLTINKSQ